MPNNAVADDTIEPKEETYLLQVTARQHEDAWMQHREDTATYNVISMSISLASSGRVDGEVSW